MADVWRIVIAPEAATDLESIHAWISRDSPDNASAVVAEMLDAIAGLAILPHRTVYQRTGKRLQTPVRVLPVGSYLILFRVDDRERAVNILTIRHAARRRRRF